MSIVRYSSWTAYWVALTLGTASGEAPTAADSNRLGSQAVPQPLPSPAAPPPPSADSSASGVAPATPAARAVPAPVGADSMPSLAASGRNATADSVAVLKAQIAGLQAYLAHSLRVSSDAKRCPVPLAIGGKPVSKPWTLTHERAASREVSPSAHRHFQAAARHNVIGTVVFFAGAALSTVGPALTSGSGGKEGAVALLFPAGLLLEAAGFLELFHGNRLRTRGYIQYDRDLRARYRIDEPLVVTESSPR